MPCGASSVAASASRRRAPFGAFLRRHRVGREVDGDPRVVAERRVHAAGAAPIEQRSVDRVADHLLRGDRRRDFEERHLHELALTGAVAMFERGDDRERGVRRPSGRRHRRDDRRPALVAGHPRHPGDLLHRLREARAVAPRAGEPERGHAHHHDVGSHRARRRSRGRTARARGVKFSTTTSHRATSRRASSRPSGWPRSRVMPRLPRFDAWNSADIS